MSMLAEPRRKKRSINLRGKNAWSDDQDKFGQKLMQKMGWTPGKGLGMKEDGITDHVKVRFKDDNGGVGYKNVDNQWTEHETNFETLLRSLHGGDVDKTKLHSEASLEEKSKKLQSRLHYKKFTRSKDITQYSHKDLANIFGKKSLLSKQVDLLKKVDKPSKKVIENPDDDLKLVEAGCMKEYFKSKLNKGVHTKSSAQNGDNSQSSDDQCSFAFQGFAGQQTSQLQDCEFVESPFLVNYSGFRKASESLPATISNTGFEKASEDLPATINNSNCDIKIKKSKKNNKGLSNTQVIDCVSEEMVSDEIYVVQEDPDTISKNLSKINEQNCLTTHENVDDFDEMQQVNSIIKKKKIAKSKGQDQNFKDELTRVVCDRSNTDNVIFNEPLTTVCGKKKTFNNIENDEKVPKKKRNHHFTIPDCDESEEILTPAIKKKKVIEVIDLTENVESPKKGKKKKKHTCV